MAVSAQGEVRLEPPPPASGVFADVRGNLRAWIEELYTRRSRGAVRPIRFVCPKGNTAGNAVFLVKTFNLQ
jgi:hypothetical protein